MFCPNCGNTLPEEARFCNQCGNSFTQHNQPSNKQAANHTKIQEVYRGLKRTKAAKIIATFAVTGGTIAVLWKPVIQPVLLSKTIGPDDLTGYTTEFDTDQNAYNDLEYPNGKWVREDGTAVLYIGSKEDQNQFRFELFVAGENESEKYQLTNEAQKDSFFEKNDEVKAMAYYTKLVDAEQVEQISFASMEEEEAIRVTTDANWITANPGKHTPDGIYYRIRKEWFWKNVESSTFIFKFLPDSMPDPPKAEEEEEVEEEKKESIPPIESKEVMIEEEVLLPGPVIEVVPPPENNGEIPVRENDPKELLGPETIQEIKDEGTYLNFIGCYYVVEAEVEDFNKFFEYYYEECDYQPDKDYCVGRQEGMMIAEARYDSLAKLEHRNYGKTKWTFSKDMSMIPDFAYLWFEEGGTYATDVTLSNGPFRVGYLLNEYSLDSSKDSATTETLVNQSNPSVFQVKGSFMTEQNSGAGIDRELEYDMNIYFHKDGTVDAEGYVTLYALGSEYIRFWLQMSAVEAQTEGKPAYEFNYKALMEPFYRFPDMEEDSLEFGDTKDTSILASDDATESVQYEYAAE